MPKTRGHDEGERAAERAGGPRHGSTRLHTRELHALVDDALSTEARSTEAPSSDAVPAVSGAAFELERTGVEDDVSETVDAPSGEPEAASDAAPSDELMDGELVNGLPPGIEHAPPEPLEAALEPAELPPEPAPPARPPMPDPYLGLVIDRRYEIQKLIAAGGMGLVYRCRHIVLGKKLAIKIIRADVAQMPDGHERFLLEAKAASAIGNEHIVDIIDFGALPDGSSYLVMEYLSGVPLSTLMKRQGRMAVPRLAELACQIAEGLGAAHAAGIVHRDLKPDNVFVLERRGEDFVKILDFGVARMEQNAKKLTQAGTIVGTPHYMSPEQATGKDVDHRGDIYALGVILYELCAGQVPFDGSHYVAVLHQHLQDEPPTFASLDPPALVPEELERIVGKCLAKLPEERYGAMAELAQDLMQFCTRSRGWGVTGALVPAVAAPTPAPGLHSRRLLGAGSAPNVAGLSHASSVAAGAEAAAPESSASPVLPVPTASLPAASPTLVLPRLTGSFGIEQKRRVSRISLVVLVVTVAWAVWHLGTSREPELAPPAPMDPHAAAAPPPAELPRPAPGPNVAPAPDVAAAPSAEPSSAEPLVGAASEAPAAEPPGNVELGPSPAASGGAEPSGDARPGRSTRRSESGSKTPRRAGSTAKGAKPAKPADTRRDGARPSGPSKARPSEELMNPWSLPR